jgi:hypothetical protein
LTGVEKPQCSAMNSICLSDRSGKSSGSNGEYWWLPKGKEWSASCPSRLPLHHSAEALHDAKLDFPIGVNGGEAGGSGDVEVFGRTGGKGLLFAEVGCGGTALMKDLKDRTGRSIPLDGVGDGNDCSH